MALIEHTLFGVTDKVQESIDLIKAYEPEEGYYVAFSGGKDSIVTLDLVKRSGVKYDAHYMRAMEPPEVVYFIRKHYPEVQRHLPKKNMFRLIREQGIPPIVSLRYCCRVLKEQRGLNRHRITITGIRRAESRTRKNRKEYETVNGKLMLAPIVSWSDFQVWEYIRFYNLPYPEIYETKGMTRVGCVMCGAASYKERARQARLWPKIANAYRRACIRAYDPAIARTWKDGNDMYEWWLSGKVKELEGDMLWDENDV